MWALEALQGDHALTLVTTREVDWDALNAFSGTRVRGDAVAVVRPRWPGLVQGLGPGAAFRRAVNQRQARRVAADHDVVISAYNPVDFGRSAIQLIGDLSWDGPVAARYDAPPPGLRGRLLASRVAHGAYRWVVGRLRAPSGWDVLGRDRVVANSGWVAELMAREHGLRPEVLFPPVPGDFPEVPWERRAHRFVSVGRIAPEKRVERLIAIVAGVRRRGHDVALHLAGPVGRDAYGREIARLAQRSGPWVVLTGPVHGAEKAALLAGSRFGLHGREGEPFGIAVAELVRAGCVPFVPAVGGPAEIVDHAGLTWVDEADAVARIDRMLRAPAALAGARTHLAARAPLFGTAAFVTGVRALVAEALAGRFGAKMKSEGA